MLPTDRDHITKPLLSQTESELMERAVTARQLRERAEKLERSLTSAIASMGKTDAALQLDNVNISTSARNASRVDMERWNAKSMRQCEELGKRPRYLRHSVYRNDDLSSRSCADWTETAQPLASIPDSELSNDVANHTLENYAHLFEVNTPIDVDNFQRLLERHPNPLFIESVVNGFQNGFWPWADTHIGDYPDTVDESLGDPKGEAELNFICEQRDKEIALGRFSKSFGKELLPGMYRMPNHVVPKPHSDDFRLVTNQSPGAHSLNSMIRCEDILWTI